MWAMVRERFFGTTLGLEERSLLDTLTLESDSILFACLVLVPLPMAFSHLSFSGELTLPGPVPRRSRSDALLVRGELTSSWPCSIPSADVETWGTSGMGEGHVGTEWEEGMRGDSGNECSGVDDEVVLVLGEGC